MAKANPVSKRAKYSKEVEKIKGLRDLNRILKAGDVENALLSNSAKDSETLNDNVLDSMLSKADSYDQGNERGLDTIERLTSAGGGTIVRQRMSARPRRITRAARRQKPKRAKARPKRRSAKKKR